MIETVRPYLATMLLAAGLFPTLERSSRSVPPRASSFGLSAWGVAALLAGCTSAPPAHIATPPHAVIGVRDAHLDPLYWIRRERSAQTLVLDRNAIAAQNERLERLDPSVRDLEALAGGVSGDDVRRWIGALVTREQEPLYDDQSHEITAEMRQALEDRTNVEAVPATQPARYGLIVRRADVRTFPTRLRVFRRRGDTDIDRFQESALFPGTPVVVAHESRDGEWWFVVSAAYAAWVEKSYVAIGTKDEVFGYARKQPYVVVTGSSARTVFTPQQPEVSELQLDMGVRAPLLAAWPADRPVNGQHPYAAHVIELPTRAADGTLRFAPALLPKTNDIAAEYLRLTRANLLRQSFKFLGERYGWGHSYNARDCSGFVSEVYRSFGVTLPRNSFAQGSSPALNRIELTEADGHARRLAVLRTLEVGDLIYIPGHVMMVIGHENGMPYVIHDTTGITYRNGAAVKRVTLNGVSVTPLTPLLASDGQPMIDTIYSIQRIRP